MNKIFVLIAAVVFSSSAFAASKTAIVTCEFKNKQKTVLRIDLNTKKAKQLNNAELDEFPVVGEMDVISHTTLFGTKLSSFNEVSEAPDGTKEIWDAQLVLMGSNHDDTNYSLIIGYRNSDGSEKVKATLITYELDLDGMYKVEPTSKCSIKI